MLNPNNNQNTSNRVSIVNVLIIVMVETMALGTSAKTGAPSQALANSPPKPPVDSSDTAASDKSVMNAVGELP